MRGFQLITLLAALATVCLAEYKRYDGYQLLRIYPKDSAQADYVFELSGDDEIDFWYEGRDRFDILVPPHKLEAVKYMMTSHDVVYKVENSNVQRDIDMEQIGLLTKKKEAGRAVDYDNYNTLQDILDELDVLAARCPPGSMCETFNIGNSVEGRPIKGLRIWRAGAGRRAIWLDATIHAREWLATATHLKIMKHLIDDYTNPIVADLLARYDFWLNPVANPDGYQFTNTNDRLWRKNRKPNPGSTCIGTDLNRNYNQMWGNAGAATTPCSETFRGASAASEPETQAVQAYILARASTLMLTIHFHTYGHLWLQPWGSVNPDQSCNYAADDAEMLVVANAAANAVQSTYNQATWQRGNSCATIYPASGITMDYSKGVAGVKYTFTPELRGTNFVIAASNIQPSFVEVWNGVVAGIRAIEQAEKSD